MSIVSGLTVPLTKRQLLLAMLGVGSVALLGAVDGTVVGVVMPQAVDELHGMAVYAWVGIAYLLSNAVSIPIAGRLGDLYGRKRFIQVSLVLVIVSSLMCVFTPNMPFLIFSRFLQGIGGGILIGTSFASAADLFSDRVQRVRWQAVVSSSFAVGSGLGPSLGGLLTQAFGWRSAFLLTPSVAVMALVLITRYLPNMKPKRVTKPSVDIVGAFFLALAVAAPILSLDWFFSPDHANLYLGSMAAVIMLGSVFFLIRYERYPAFPILPLHIFQSKPSRQLFLLSFIVGAVMFMLVFYAPLMLQNVFNFSPYKAGMILTPLVGMIPVGSIINGRLYSKMTEPQRLLVLGAVLLAIGCFGTASLDASSHFLTILFIFSIAGLGLGLVLPNLTLYIQFVSDRQDVGLASAVVQTMRSMGSAVGVAAVNVAVGYLGVQKGIHIGLLCSAVVALLLSALALRLRIPSSSLGRAQG